MSISSLKTINMFAADYAKHSGYPLVTIKNYCKSGIIPHDRLGRKYLINVDLADKALLERMQGNQSSNFMQADPAEKGSNKMVAQSAQVFDFTAQLKALRTGG